MVGGVAGMLLVLSEGMVVDGMLPAGEPIEAPVMAGAAGMVAEVSVDMPVEAEPLHQSLLARTLGEALR